MCLDHEKTLAILNKHADIVASDFTRGTKKFEKLFSKFIKAFELSNYDVSHLDRKEAKVAVAYEAFVTCLETEVKKSRPQSKPKSKPATKPKSKPPTKPHSKPPTKPNSKPPSKHK